MTRMYPPCYALCLFAACIALAGAADFDELLGGGEEGGDDILLELDGEKRVTPDQWKERMGQALRETRPAARRTQVTELLRIMVRQKDIILLPREFNTFVDAVLASVTDEYLTAFIPKLLEPGENLQFDPAAQTSLNLGIRFTLTTGNASFEQLASLLKQYKSFVDLEWLLPALGRTGGAKALPLVRPHRNDRAIIPVGNVQNIRRTECAAVLACAYAGEQEAVEIILTWYEQDFLNRPIFAFHVTWALQEGLKPDYEKLDYVQHRISQAERLFDFLGEKALPDLITRANRDLSVSLTDYLTRRMSRASGEQFAPFLPLMDHPSIIVKQKVLAAVLDRGTDAAKTVVTGKVAAFLRSDRGLERFFAAEALWRLDRAAHRDAVLAALSRETSPSVRLRMQALTRE